MIRSKIDPQSVGTLTWKAYLKLFNKDLKQAQDKGLSQVPLVMISDFVFACGEVHSLILLGKQSAMTKYFKALKTDENRKKLKDFAIGLAHLAQDERGELELTIAIEGFGKPSRMKKNSKKLAQKLGLNIKDIIKGSLTDEVTTDIEQEEKNLTEEEHNLNNSLQDEAEELKVQDDQFNDDEKIGRVARAFIKANKKMMAQVIPLLKSTKQEAVVFTEEHINLAQQAFRAAASLVDRYEEVAAASGRISKKITSIKQHVEDNQLVQKYEAIWKKVTREHQKQGKDLGTSMLSEDMGGQDPDQAAFLDELNEAKKAQMQDIQARRKKIETLLQRLKAATNSHV